jgi:polar amino acid transport system substrate-binding protein
MISKKTARPTRAKLAAVAVVLLALTVSACGKSSGSGGDAAKLDGIKLVKSGKLTTCTHLSYKPFEYKDGTKVVGFDVDLLDLLAKDLGVEQEVISIEWAQITSGAAFQARKCDMGMGAMTITKTRQGALDITQPYMDASQVLLVKKGAPYKSLEDLKGKKVGVQADTTGKDFATAAATKDGFEVVVFNDLALQTNSVKSGRVDAAINDNGALYNFVTANPDTEVATEFDTGEKYGFAAKKGDPSGDKLVSKFNDLLAKAKSDGTYNTIYKKWFGIEPKK